MFAAFWHGLKDVAKSGNFTVFYGDGEMKKLLWSTFKFNVIYFLLFDR